MTDYTWQNNQWLPRSPLLHGFSDIVFSPTSSLDAPFPSINLSVQFPQGQFPGPHSSLFALCGMEYQQKVDGQMYSIAKANALEIADVL